MTHNMSERQNQKRKQAQKEANQLKKRMIEKVLSSKTSNYALNLNYLVDGWLELESDPGTFSLLIEDFGCFGAQVEEIYDLDQKFEGPIFGFIFLFKWLNNHQSDRSRNQKSTSSYDQANEQQTTNQGQWSYVEDEAKINEMFFAKQMISNSCATHALISVLLNCAHEELNLGPTLARLKEHTKVMDPENKGYAIGNLPEIAKAHNSHASFSSLYNRDKPSHLASGMSYMISGNQRTNLQQQKKHEAYHFVSYVPIKNRLYEFDGLKNYPIDHGPFDPKKDWTEKFKAVIKQRLANKSGDDPNVSNDIRYNLMAVVPDKRLCLKTKLKVLKNQRDVVKSNMEQLTKRTTPLSIDVDIPNPPYSPLSNATLTASESGSPPHSPSSNEINGYNSDDDSRFDKYFFVKFDQNADSLHANEDNTEPAHKNCIIKVEPTHLNPLNLKKLAETESKPEQEDEESKVQKAPESCQNVDILPSDAAPVAKEKKENGLTNSIGGDEPNAISAHSNELYNLSNKPPFDFNIIDELQHVHSDKTTLRDLTSLSDRLGTEIDIVDVALKDEVEKRRKYKVDNARRTHNYEPFIMTFLSMLASHGKLADLIERDLGITSEDTTSTNPQPSSTVVKTPVKDSPKITKPKYKYVSTGRPVGRPRKNPPLTTPTNNKSSS